MEAIPRELTTRRRRATVTAAAAVVALLTLAPSSLEAGSPASSPLHFSRLPSRAVAGESVTVAVARARAGATCSLDVGYGKSSTQSGLRSRPAVDGTATWTWTIPSTVEADRASLVAGCTGSKRISTKLLVVGSLIPPRMSVLKDGFSARASTTASTDVSYGVIIQNQSPNADALNVHVLVNFVLANNHLLGSASSNIAAIPAGTSYALGNNLGFPGAAPIARLEIVIQVGASNRHVGHPPALANVVIERSTYDRGWVGDIAGELINNDSHLTLQSTQYSAVILDSAGNVLGGGSGSSYGSPLPPGTREVFKLSNGGFKDVPVDKAASAIVSAIPTWQTAAT